MLFASLILERQPAQWSNLPAAAVGWLQNAGVVAAFGIALVLLARAAQRDSKEWIIWTISEKLKPLFSLLYYFIIAAAIGYGALILLWLGDMFKIPKAREYMPRGSVDAPYTIGDWILVGSGILALSVVMTPVIIDLITRISCGRIWAIARLSWKEAVRGRVIWVFGAMALIFLFADWFVPYKAENQVRSYVQVIYWSMTPLFLITAALLGAFSIPTDVLNNTIHTIVTKPVEKFEIVMGRFLGYAGLLTVGLFALTSLSLIYVVRGVNEEAKHESYRARIPIYGKLHFAGTKDAQRADSVGREWGYRSYITGPTRKQRAEFRQFAIWDFAHIPPDLGERDVPILFEFSFDIFRLSKGDKEGKGVHCTFTFADGDLDSRQLDRRVEDMSNERRKREKAAVDQRNAAMRGKSEQELIAIEAAYKAELERITSDLTTQFRIFQKTEEVIDYHTQTIKVPPQVIKTLAKHHDDSAVPMMRAFMSVDVADQAQMVGVAQQDFYLLAYERPFWQNFLKGVIGMWCTHMLVLGIAVACSTYLSSVISLLATLFLFTAGMFVDYLKEIAERRLDGGGPAESMWRLGTRAPIAQRLENSPTHNVLTSLDSVFSWWIGRIMNLLPDVNRHDLHLYVANGFDIGWLDVLLLDNFLPLFAYMTPWAVLAYYLMKYREIANPQ